MRNKVQLYGECYMRKDRLEWLKMKRFTIDLVSNALSHCQICVWNKIVSVLELSISVGPIGWSIRGSKLRVLVPFNVLDCYSWRFLVSHWGLIKNATFFLLQISAEFFHVRKKGTKSSLIGNRNKQNGSCVRMKVSQRTQNFGNSLLNKKSSSVITILELGHFLGGDLCNESGNLMGGER